MSDPRQQDLSLGEGCDTKENRIHFEGNIIQLSPEGEVNSGG